MPDDPVNPPGSDGASPPSQAPSRAIGKVLGTQDATPLEFWVAIDDENYLQLDDVVAVGTEVPGAGGLRISGVVDMVRSRHEGSRFDSDVFLADQGLLPVQTARAAHERVCAAQRTQERAKSRPIGSIPHGASPSPDGG